MQNRHFAARTAEWLRAHRPYLRPRGAYFLSPNVVVLYGSREVLDGVHEETAECHEHGCCIHAPTNHSMRHMPLHWRRDRKLMERVCVHGIGHPDPDHLNFVRRTCGGLAAVGESIHGCDGCCA